MSFEYNIYYSTHSGTSERFAIQISEQLSNLGIPNLCKNISEF